MEEDQARARKEQAEKDASVASVLRELQASLDRIERSDQAAAKSQNKGKK